MHLKCKKKKRIRRGGKGEYRQVLVKNGAENLKIECYFQLYTPPIFFAVKIEQNYNCVCVCENVLLLFDWKIAALTAWINMQSCKCVRVCGFLSGGIVRFVYVWEEYECASILRVNILLHYALLVSICLSAQQLLSTLPHRIERVPFDPVLVITVTLPFSPSINLAPFIFVHSVTIFMLILFFNKRLLFCICYSFV